MKIRFFFAACFIFVLCGFAVGKESSAVKLKGNLLDMFFSVPLSPSQEKSEFLPTHAWKTGEQFEFGMKQGSDSVYFRIEVDKDAGDVQKTPDQVFRSELKNLSDTFHPKGKIVKVVNALGQKIPIMAFTNVGGDETVSVFWFLDSYRINIEISQDDTFHSYARNGFASEMEEIISTLTIVKK